MQLQHIDQIDDRLELIKQMINLEDAYYINDVIMSNISDPQMPELVQEILDLNSYEDDVMRDVLAVVIEIQHLANGEDPDDIEEDEELGRKEISLDELREMEEMEGFEDFEDIENIYDLDDAQ